jgi:hypothetical protein
MSFLPSTKDLMKLFQLDKVTHHQNRREMILKEQLVRLWKEAVIDYFQVLSQHLPENTW